MYFPYSLYLYHHWTKRVGCYKNVFYYTLTVTKYCNEYFCSIINCSFISIPYFFNAPHRVRRFLPSLKPLERSAFGFFYGGKITLSHLIKQKCCIWGSGSLWTQRTDDQIFKELHQNFLVLVQLYPGALRKYSEIIYGERL